MAARPASNLPVPSRPTPPQHGPAAAPPQRPSDGPLARLLFFVLAAFCVVYLVNPTLGVFEFLPDNLPVVGNLDEAGATAALIWSVRRLFSKRGRAD